MRPHKVAENEQMRLERGQRRMEEKKKRKKMRKKEISRRRREKMIAKMGIWRVVEIQR